jgi:predicted nuclease of predicted toxin-antitoxin system
MNFLLDANMPRSAIRVLAEHEHTAIHVNDVGLGDALDEQVAAWAVAESAVLITRDLDFADIRSYPPRASPGILVVRVPDDWTAIRIVGLLEEFLSMEELVTRIPGHLVILDRNQARFRPALY